VKTSTVSGWLSVEDYLRMRSVANYRLRASEVCVGGDLFCCCEVAVGAAEEPMDWNI